jgi:Caspase domain
MATAAHAQDRVALVITNQDYGSEFGVLSHAHKDGRRIGVALWKLGYDVTYKQDANRDGLIQAVRDYAARLKSAGPDASGFLYFAGHAAANRPGGENHLVPVGAPVSTTLQLPQHAVGLTDIVAWIESAGLKTSFIVVDAYRNALLPRVSDTFERFEGFAPVSERQGLFLAFPTMPGHMAVDESLYAHVLAEEIVKRGLEAKDVFNRVNQRVREVTSKRQSPSYIHKLFQSYYFVEGVTPPAFGPIADGLADLAPASITKESRPLLHGVISHAERWRTGQTLKICFIDGTPKARARVADIASEWTQYANLTFDFGALPDCRGDGKEHVRVSFTLLREVPPYPYFSLIGTDSLEGSLLGEGPEAPSLYLHGFGGHDIPAAMTNEAYRAHILHEFGHVLGFWHASQSPQSNCSQEMNWPVVRSSPLGQQLEPVLAPGFGGENTRSFWFGAYDRASVMHLQVPASFYLKGQDSPCWPLLTGELSDGDKAMAALTYPALASASPDADREFEQKLIEEYASLLRKDGMPEAQVGTLSAKFSQRFEARRSGGKPK